ncbi:MAG: DUF5681 domain-containing protein [Alphaproteobacteria bacterium]|nr:DUF5681 domain-containing protein [Alphaproteobacteria bacterium]
MQPETTHPKQDTRFKPGQSGNPAGRPKGSRHKYTLAAQELLAGESESLTRKAIELALEGDVTALRLCLERIAPALKATAPTITLETPMPESLTETAHAFVKAAFQGEIAPDIAAQLVSAVASVARTEELENVKERLESLERAIKERRK